MSEHAMAIGEADLARIGEYVRRNLKEWLQDVEPSVDRQNLVTTAQFQAGMDHLDGRFVHTQERLIRLEEELKAQREVMVTRFEAMDMRFEDQKTSFIERFEDQKTSFIERFEDQKTSFIELFEDHKASFNKRFSLLTWMIGAIMAIVVAILGVLLA